MCSHLEYQAFELAPTVVKPFDNLIEPVTFTPLVMVAEAARTKVGSGTNPTTWGELQSLRMPHVKCSRWVRAAGAQNFRCLDHGPELCLNRRYLIHRTRRESAESTIGI